MSDDQSFLDRCLAGSVGPDEIDDFVDRWHEAPNGLELHDYLGMTRAEYSLWVRVPDALPCIIKARADALPLAKAVSHACVKSSGVPADRAKIARLKEWLKAQGELA